MSWSYRYTVLAFCSVVFAFYHAARQLLPPALPLMKDQFGLSYAQAGFVAAAYDIGYGLTLIVGGYLADRVNKVRLIVAGVVLLSISLALTTLSTDFVSASAVRILTGTAFGLYFAAGVSIISSYFSRQERGRALGIHTGMGAGSGKLFAPLLAGLLLPVLGWQPLFYIVGIPVFIVALVFWRVVREPEREQVTPPSLGGIFREVFCNRFLNMLGVCNALVIGTAVTLYSFVPLYLVDEMGTPVSYGGYAVAFLNGVSIPIVPTLGALSDRLGRKVVIFTLSLCGAVALYSFPLLASGEQALLGILVLGLCVGTAYPVIVTYVVDVTPLSYRSMALGYLNTFSITGGTTATVLSGYISDSWGVRMVFPFLAALSALSALFILLLVEPRAAEVGESAAG